MSIRSEIHVDPVERWRPTRHSISNNRFVDLEMPVSARWRAATYTAAAAATLGLLAASRIQSTPGHWATAIASVFVGILLAHLIFRNEGLRNQISDERSYRSFALAAIEGVFRTTEDGQYLFANPALARIYGYSSPEHLKGELIDIADQLYVDASRRTEFQKELRENGFVADFQSQICRRDGTVIWISENSRSVHDSKGNFLFYEGTVEDITARREAEEATRRAIAETNAAVRSKNAFLAAVSHELKTPLNAVIGFSELILTEYHGPFQPTKYREYVTDILGSGRKLLEMVTDILDFTRIEGNLVTMNDAAVNVPEVLRETAELVRTECSGQLIVTECPPDLPMLRGDERCIRRALAHLLRNAVEYAEPGATVSIRADLMLEDRIAISVTGPATTQDRPETRDLSERLADRGLCLANAFVRLHDGEILVERLPQSTPKIALLFPSNRTEIPQIDARIAGPAPSRVVQIPA